MSVQRSRNISPGPMLDRFFPDRWVRPELPLEQLLAEAVITETGPGRDAAELITKLGRQHGRHQRRWEPAKDLVGSVAVLAARTNQTRLDSERIQANQRLAALKSQVESLERTIAQLEASGSSTAGVSVLVGESGRYTDVANRARQAQLGRMRRQLAELRDEIERLTAALAEIAATLASLLRTIRAGAEALWADYRTAYVDRLSGPADAQQQGPGEDLGLDSLPQWKVISELIEMEIEPAEPNGQGPTPANAPQSPGRGEDEPREPESAPTGGTDGTA